MSFEQGLTILTGETGAGKSIIIGALSLLMGERADTQALRNSNEKCILEARFNIHHLPAVQALLEEHDFDTGEELIIRREISAQGKSRVFIQDSPATLTQLVPIGQQLIDLHRQFDTIELQQQGEQLHLLDDIAALQTEANQCKQAYRHWKQLNNQLQERQQVINALQQEADYHQFLFDELEAFQWQANELEQLENEQERLSNNEALQQAFEEAVFRLKESPDQQVQFSRGRRSKTRAYGSHEIPPFCVRHRGSLRGRLMGAWPRGSGCVDHAAVAKQSP